MGRSGGFCATHNNDRQRFCFGSLHLVLIDKRSLFLSQGDLQRGNVPFWEKITTAKSFCPSVRTRSNFRVVFSIFAVAASGVNAVAFLATSAWPGVWLKMVCVNIVPARNWHYNHRI